MVLVLKSHVLVLCLDISDANIKFFLNSFTFLDKLKKESVSLVCSTLKATLAHLDI